jgi:hypothetical protein
MILPKTAKSGSYAQEQNSNILKIPIRTWSVSSLIKVLMALENPSEMMRIKKRLAFS